MLSQWLLIFYTMTITQLSPLPLIFKYAASRFIIDDA